MSFRFIEGFETVGTDTGEADRLLISPNVEKRWSLTGASISPTTDGWYLVDDEFSEGFALHMGNGSASNQCFLRYDVPEALKEPADNDNEPWVIGLRVHVPSVSRSWMVCQCRGLDGVSTPFLWELQIENSANLRFFTYPGNVQTLQTTVNDAVSGGQWFYIEIKFNHAASGDFQVQVDESLLIDETAEDLNNISTENIENFQFNGATSGGTATDFVGYDDFYIKFDPAAAEDFIGVSRIRALALDGETAANWDNQDEMTLGVTLDGASETVLDVGTGGIASDVPQTGTLRVTLDDGSVRDIDYTAHNSDDEFTIVDESWANPNDATAGNAVIYTANLPNNYLRINENGLDENNYVWTDINLDQDNYTVEDDSSSLPTNNVVHAVKQEVEAINDTGGTPSLFIKMDSNSVIVEQEETIDNTTAYVIYDQTLELNPDGDTPWTIADVNALALGIRMENNVQ